jgi:hypothetical protein
VSTWRHTTTSEEHTASQTMWFTVLCSIDPREIYESSTIFGPSNKQVADSINMTIFRTGRLERELQIVQFSATGCSYIAILWVSLVSFAAIALCVASQRAIPKVSVQFSSSTQYGNFWIHPRIKKNEIRKLSRWRDRNMKLTDHLPPTNGEVHSFRAHLICIHGVILRHGHNFTFTFINILYTRIRRKASYESSPNSRKIVIVTDTQTDTHMGWSSLFPRWLSFKSTFFSLYSSMVTYNLYGWKATNSYL